MGYVAKGLKFHKFYFDLPPAAGDAPAVKPNVTLCDVHVRMLSGGIMYILYVYVNVCVCVYVCVCVCVYIYIYLCIYV